MRPAAPTADETPYAWGKPQWTAAEIDDVCALLAAGNTLQSVATKYGLSRNTTKFRCERLGIRDPANPGNRRNWSAAEDALIISRRLEGRPWSAIADEIGAAGNTVRARGSAIGALVALPGPEVMHEDRRRFPHPPGHPSTWGLLLALTPSIAGVAYA